MDFSPTKNAPEQTDFLIVGAGPVGLLTAILLGREGFQVIITERWPARYPMPRACTIDHEALRILQSAGLMDKHSNLFEPSLGERGGYQIRNGAGELLRQINWNRPAESGWANTNGFYQPDLEAVLESMAVELPTVQLLRGWSAAGLTQDDTGVTLIVNETADTENQRSIRGNWLIAADGANSTVRALVGISTVESDFEADWLVVDYQPIHDKPWDAFVTQYCDPAQPATAVNSGPGRRRFEFMRRADVSVEELGRPETAWQLMKPWDVTPENARLERHAVYTFRGRWAEDWRSGRVFLAGDAAHLMPPFLGQGLCAGLRDVRSLTWRLVMVARGEASEAVLDSYCSERSAHVREIIQEAIDLGKVICELDPVRAANRDAQMKSQLDDPTALTVEPPLPQLGRPSISADGDPNAGRLWIQARVETAEGAGLFDDIVGGGWQLTGFDVGPLADVPAELRLWFHSIGGVATSIKDVVRTDDTDNDVSQLPAQHSEVLGDSEGAYRTWFDEHGCSVVLSRPDFYIYGSGTPEDVPGLLTSLRAALTRPPTTEKTGALR